MRVNPKRIPDSKTIKKIIILSSGGVFSLLCAIMLFMRSAEQWQDRYYWQNRLNCSSEQASQIVAEIDDVARTTATSYGETTKRVLYLYGIGFGLKEAINTTWVIQDRLRKTGIDITNVTVKAHFLAATPEEILSALPA